MNKSQRHLKGLSYAKYGYLFAIPFIVIFLIFQLYPTLYTAFIGFTDMKGVNPVHVLDHPFDNFKDIVHNQTFLKSLRNTVVIWIMNFIPQITLALILTAWFTSRTSKLKGQGFFKVVFYMPNIITAATIAILFSTLFGFPTGPVNQLLKSWGIRATAFDFMTSKSASKLIVAFIQFWTWYGNTMILLVSGVLGISPDIYEAADIDGANGVQTFFRITLPNLKTVLLYTLITSMIGGLNMFDIPLLFNRGGPDGATTTASVFIYQVAFTGTNLYYRAAAASMVLFVIVLILSAILFYLMRDKDAIAMEKMKKAERKKHKMKERRGF
ncbi:MAG: sugar ABC transporter permease [Oscillospiraceae bacterium]|nr:sugar ABC transporter permease [Oscillospiraceae bacterium]